MEHGARELLSKIQSNVFCNLMASVAQNVRENPQHAPCNNDNNTEFEGGWQNVIGCSCVSVSVYILNTLLAFIHVAEKYYHCTRHSGVDHSQQS